uniref:SUEL-type lectin domain-containing protein n=1 Tax=Haplochromis burtoni TaxID=8153 RepID=A0A3Q2X3F0_HAPBU
MNFFLFFPSVVFCVLLLRFSVCWSVMEKPNEGQVIVVSWANYGRRDKTTCPDGRSDSELQNVKCSWSASMEYFTKMCNWQNSCTVEAPSLVDPCHGTYEYLETTYDCFTRQSVICEGSQANLQCGENTASMSLYMKDSMEYVTNRCNGKNNCTVEVESSVDLCAGTYKYLEVF